ncbi:branched-chain amino acid ABC transporter substrate-binding protein [Desulfoluna spongiiphila]|uniref:Branched-chain amino acid transport system substrate-binding protein n=1 Tax=Desulfoluna spongiiphila TaxID=419481 RepID=A0A1G5IEZ2_9BACT|nr:branched-chain amino acid ABC transporter substrate-binding protein [Desulfoluna spongiiphila]SCY74260.1 branched-chain amino acid transport system substrate-binding protein [Desulfoluna spongiiphila]VVS95413.1 leu/ile/val-binding protein [Desulfoluna spongiiphila]
MKRFYISFTATVLSVLFALCLTAGQVFAADTIKLGVAGAHSGDLASYGLPTVNAARFVVADINAAGGVLGKQVEMITEDDVCKPEVATSTATKLVTSGVDIVLGHICSGATKAALGIYNGAGLVCISPSATAPDLTVSGDYPNFFRTIAHDKVQAELQVKFVIETLGAKKIAILHDKGDYGKGAAILAREFVKASPKAEVVLFEGVTSGSVSFGPIVQKVKRSRADVVIWGGYHSDASKIIRQMNKKKVKSLFVGADGLKDETFIKVAGKDAEGVYVSGPMDYSKNPLAIKAKEQHLKAFGEDPGAFYLEAYAATLAILNAVEKAGSTDYDAVVKALRTEDVDTPLGKIRFDEKGDPIGVGFTMYQVKNGQFVELN